MNHALRKEIHARHIAFLDRLKAKAVEAHSEPISAPVVEVEKPKVEQWIPRWRKNAFAICAKHDVEWADIMKQNRVGKIVRARQEICWDMVVNLKMSFNHVAAKLDRDHTTVMHAVNRHKKLLEAQNNECE